MSIPYFGSELYYHISFLIFRFHTEFHISIPYFGPIRSSVHLQSVPSTVQFSMTAYLSICPIYYIERDAGVALISNIIIDQKIEKINNYAVFSRFLLTSNKSAVGLHGMEIACFFLAFFIGFQKNFFRKLRSRSNCNTKWICLMIKL